MTRDEAKQDLHYSLQFDTLKPNLFIDKIYDDFENKSCESCKHSEFDAVFQTFYSSSESIFCHQCSKNFTNKWESKWKYQTKT